MRFIDAQTQLVDEFLGELSQLDFATEPINFNNTNQFHALLRFLECTLSERLVQVPSTTILHVLITLATRTPDSNWTHETMNSSGGIEVSSIYMQEVNNKYQHSLKNDSLAQRSLRILYHYLEALRHDEWDEFTNRLHKHLFQVINHVCGGKRSSVLEFRPVTSASPEPVELQQVMEVIEDSESESSDLEISSGTDAERISKYRSFNLPLRSVISLSDLGNKTSGLGETAQLFKNMPHLSAHSTPEPETSPERPRKRAKTKTDPLEYVMVYDDNLLAKKLNPSYNYGFWDLLRWAFTCCDQSSEYQQFLFDSSHTPLHSIWKTYEAAFRFLFTFLERQSELAPKTGTSSLLEVLYKDLGNKDGRYDRLVAYVFTGLKIPIKNKPFPCYSRERYLINNASVSQATRYKSDTVLSVDNHDSLDLRSYIISLFLSVEKDPNNKNTLIEQLAIKLEELDNSYVFIFLRCFRANTKHFESLRNLLLETYKKLLFKTFELPDLEYWLFDPNDSLQVKLSKVEVLLCEGSLSMKILQETAFGTGEKLKKLWERFMFVQKALSNFAFEELLQSKQSATKRNRLKKYIEWADEFDQCNEIIFVSFVKDKRAESTKDVIDCEDVGVTISAHEKSDLIEFARNYRRYHSYKTEVSMKVCL